MAQEFQNQTITDPKDLRTINENFERLKTIIREQNGAIEKLKDRVTTLENK